MKFFTLLVILTIISISNSKCAVPYILWKFDLKAVSFGNSCADDIDEDGKLEIVFSTYFNDESIYALNAEDGSILWSYFTGGCNDAAPMIYDADGDGKKEVLLHSSSDQNFYCFNGKDGTIKWVKQAYGTDSPMSIADADGDGKPELIDGDFHGDIVCRNAENGTTVWKTNVDTQSSIQTEPVIADLQNDGQLECVVATWRMQAKNKIAAYKLSDGSLLWENNTPMNMMYHGPTIADIDDDGNQEVIIGSYEGILYCLNGTDGTSKWTFKLQNPIYIGAPTTAGDINGDGKYEIAFIDYYTLVVLNSDGTLLWKYPMSDYAQSFRGVILTDMNNDNILDLVLGNSAGELLALNGPNGREIFNLNLGFDYGKEFDINNAPICADFDKDGFYEIFIIGGHGESDDITKNHGRAYMVKTDCATGTDWLMFRNNYKRNAVIEKENNDVEQNQIADIKIFPNPANSKINVISNESLKSLVIYNQLGEMVLKTDKTTNIDVGKLPSGIYFISCNSDYTAKRAKLLITR